jgi:hypothetical protein
MIADALTQQAELFLVATRLANDRRGDIRTQDWRSAQNCLMIAEPIYVSKDPLEVIRTEASSVPAWPLRPEDLPTPHGFVCLAEPIPLPNPHPKITPRLLAFGWTTSRLLKPGDGALWSKLIDAGGIRPHTEGAGNAITLHMFFDGLSAEYGNPAHYPWQWYFGASQPHSLEVHRVGGAEVLAWSEAQLLITRSFFAFVNQRLITTSREVAERSGRRRAEAAGLEVRPVLVVRLRRTQSRATSEALEGARDWTCRWWVGGHWRRQPCGEYRLERRPTWIGPYIKGPAHRPIRAARRLFAVVR